MAGDEKKATVAIAIVMKLRFIDNQKTKSIPCDVSFNITTWSHGLLKFQHAQESKVEVRREHEVLRPVKNMIDGKVDQQEYQRSEKDARRRVFFYIYTVQR